jgi:subtilisin-like proprotein convertase family protein
VIVAVNPNWVHGENLTATGIGANSYTYSSINISGAPSGATVDSVTITVSINHPILSVLDIWLESPNAGQLMIWDSNYPGGTESFTTDFFAGGDVNGIWELVLYSSFTSGTLNWWEITIYWGL